MMEMADIELLIFEALKQVDADNEPSDVLAALTNVLIGIALDYGVSKDTFSAAVNNQWDRVAPIFEEWKRKQAQGRAN